MMAKKGSSSSNAGLVKKGIALLCSVVTFIFFFLEMISVVFVSELAGKSDSEGVKVSDLLFNSDYESIRESFSTTTIVLWISFILVIVAMVLAILSFVMKKGSLFAKLGSLSLLVGLLLMFIINFDRVGGELLTTFYTNVSVLYFVALVLSLVSVGVTFTLKK